MPILNRRDEDYFRDFMIDKMVSLGISTRNQISDIGQSIAVVIGDTLSIIYDDLYEIADGIMPTTATGEFQERYGLMLGEERVATGYARDLTSENTFIQIEGNEPAGYYTIDNGNIIIPQGVYITSNDGLYIVRTLNTAVIPYNAQSAPVQVICENESIRRIPANTLTDVEFDIATVENIDPNKIIDVTLSASNTDDILGQDVSLSDNDYLFVLTKKALGLGGGNRASIDAAIAKIPDAARFSIREYTHGNSSFVIFVEPTNLLFPDHVVAAVQTAVQNVVGLGTRVRVLQPEYKETRVVYKLKGNPVDVDTSALVAELADYVNNLRSGNGLSYDYINRQLPQTYGIDCEIYKIFKDNIEVPKTNVKVKWNQKLVMSRTDSVVFI